MALKNLQKKISDESMDNIKPFESMRSTCSNFANLPQMFKSYFVIYAKNVVKRAGQMSELSILLTYIRMMLL